MPIKGYAKADAFAGLPELIRLRKGSEKVDGKLGRDQDWFRPTFSEGYEYLAAPFAQLYGDKPTRFEGIRVLAESAESAFDYWLEEWNASQTLLHRCDGETQAIHFDTRANQYVTAPTACAASASPACHCSKVGRLNLFFPEFAAMTGGIGRIVALTHSHHDIKSVAGYLSAIEAAIKPAGMKISDAIFDFWRADRLVGIPKIVNKQVVGRTVGTKSLWHLKLNEASALQIAGLLGGEMPALPQAGDSADALPAGTRWVDTEKWQNFLTWSHSEFGVTSDQVFNALSVAAGELIETATQWQGDDIQAASAVIAYAHEYVAQAALGLASKLKLADPYKVEIKRICEAYGRAIASGE